MSKITAGFALLATSALALTGCTPEAALIRDSTLKTMENTSYQFSSTMKLTGNFADELKKDKTFTPENASILESVMSGVTIEGTQTDLTSGKYTITLNNDKALRDNKLWTGDKKASVEMIVDNSDLYIKSALDKKYLNMNNDTMYGETFTLSPEEMKKFNQEVNELSMKFARNYVKGFDFKGTKVENKGEKTVKLPNGEEVKTTHVAVSLDTNKLIDLVYYVAKDGIVNPEVRTFAIDVATLGNKMDDQMQKLPLKKDEEYRKEATTQVDTLLAEAKVGFAELEKEYTPAKLAEEAKKAGLEDLNITLEYYVDKNKLPVRTTSTFDLKVKNTEEKDAKSMTVGFAVDTYAWNFGKTNPYTKPGKNDFVTVDDLKKDKEAIKNFDEKGFFHQFVKSVSTDFDFETLEEEAVETKATTPAPATK
ncbi:hypothetical protein [Brevibacillus daliensis]|uniref:hypothetical protein n=1 Tax=Brevibacillus daliensis TaxID=2892995 RepID=UPI001E62701A|nr:hypothetical protein [Brevibacillus daliensis]